MKPFIPVFPIAAPANYIEGIIHYTVVKLILCHIYSNVYFHITTGQVLSQSPAFTTDLSFIRRLPATSYPGKEWGKGDASCTARISLKINIAYPWPDKGSHLAKKNIQDHFHTSSYLRLFSRGIPSWLHEIHVSCIKKG